MEKYDSGLKVIAKAQAARDAGDKKGAHELFVKGIEELLALTKRDPGEKTKALVKKHVTKFMAEAEELLGIAPPPPASPKSSASATPPPTRTTLKRAEMLERNGREEQRKLNWQKAWKTYAEAAEAYQKHTGEVEGSEAAVKQAQLKTLEMVRLAENMQRLYKNPFGSAPSNQPSTSAAAAAENDLFALMPSPPTAEDAAARASMPPKPMAEQLAISPEGGLSNSLVNAFVSGKQKTEEERKVLIAGAKINGRLYEPLYTADTELKNFVVIGEFKDADGLPKMSPKQKDKGAVWGRPSQFLGKPTVIKDFTYHCIRQTLVGDCSFVASLAVCACWEHRFQKVLISRNIYPQDAKRNPMVSPSGRYLVKMFLNGCIRGVVIDDFFPVVKDSSGETSMVCTFSKHADELWVSLFEKAYMKLHGGYDFPGSTSSIDLHALCGWIPETFHLDPEKKRDGEPSQEEAWGRVKLAHKKGTALFTMGTKEMTEEEEERTGLCGGHAYAVLDVVEEVGQRLVKLKNPWANIRWKGDYSPGDDKHWTPELKKALRYDADASKDVDDGIFWISWDAICNFFASVHGSWSPSRFTSRKTVHGYLSKKVPDKKHFDHNPQYHLRAKAARPSSVWLLLVRHYQDTSNEPYCCFHVYKGGRKVLSHSEEACVVRSVYSSSPNCLVRLPIPQGDSSHTLVVSLYDDTGVLPFTLTSYAVEPHNLTPAMDCPYVEAPQPGLPNGGQKQSWMARWEAATAGGSMNEDAWDANPQFKIQITGAGPQVIFVKAEAQGKEDRDVGIHLFHGGVRCHRRTCQRLLTAPKLPSDPRYTPMLCWREYAVGAGSYTLVASTFTKGQCGEFSVTVRTRNPLFVTTIPYSPPPPAPSEPAIAPAKVEPAPPTPAPAATPQVPEINDPAAPPAPIPEEPDLEDPLPKPPKPPSPAAPPAPARPPNTGPPPPAPPSTLEGLLGPKPVASSTDSPSSAPPAPASAPAPAAPAAPSYPPPSTPPPPPAAAPSQPRPAPPPYNPPAPAPSPPPPPAAAGAPPQQPPPPPAPAAATPAAVPPSAKPPGGQGGAVPPPNVPSQPPQRPKSS